MKYRCLVLIGPSAGGKSTTKDLLVQAGKARYGVTCTTRKPRTGEENGVDYDFLADEEFDAADLAERTRYIANPVARYGILRQRIAEAEVADVPTVWVLDSAGLAWMHEHFKGQTLAVTLTADRFALQARLEKRALDEGKPVGAYLPRLDSLAEEMELALQDADAVIDTSHATAAEVAQRILSMLGA